MDNKDNKFADEKGSDEASHGHVENGGSTEYLDDCAHREKQIIRRIDWRLLPILGALYAIALIDRINVGKTV
jgi:hypothetical protein